MLIASLCSGLDRLALRDGMLHLSPGVAGRSCGDRLTLTIAQPEFCKSSDERNPLNPFSGSGYKDVVVVVAQPPE